MGCHFLLQCMKVESESEVAQSGPTLSDPMDCSLPGSCIHGIFQARVLEWVAIVFSGQAVKQKLRWEWGCCPARVYFLGLSVLICSTWELRVGRT